VAPNADGLPKDIPPPPTAVVCPKAVAVLAKPVCDGCPKAEAWPKAGAGEAPKAGAGEAALAPKTGPLGAFPNADGGVPAPKADGAAPNDGAAENAGVEGQGHDGATPKADVEDPNRVAEALLPLLRASKASPRLVNVASMAGKLSQLSPALQAKFSSPTLTLPQLRALVAQFEADVAAGRHRANGWSHSNYGMSKLALIAATRVLARELPGVRVNTCCPGYCDTDMSSHRGPRPPAEGARNAVLLATLPDDGPTGTFWRDYKAASW